MQMGQLLRGVRRCPHCGVASPALHIVGDMQTVFREGQQVGHTWAMYSCSSCSGAILAQSGLHDARRRSPEVRAIYPDVSSPDEALPESVQAYLKQATESLHSPDGAAMLAGAAVDAMLKEKGYSESSVYVRIEQAVKDNVLTFEMGEWAHDVRLGSNRPRHADKDKPHVNADEAKQAVEFATMLGHFLFVLPARVRAKAEAAKQAG